MSEDFDWDELLTNIVKVCSTISLILFMLLVAGLCVMVWKRVL